MKIHTGDRRHACPHCDKKFIQAQQLRAHIFYHTGENGFECELCPMRFNKRGRLDAHVQSVHDTNKYLTCDVCQEKFRFKGKLAKHLREHIREAKAAAAVGKREKSAKKRATADVEADPDSETAETEEVHTEFNDTAMLEIEEMIVQHAGRSTRGAKRALLPVKEEPLEESRPKRQQVQVKMEQTGKTLDWVGFKDSVRQATIC